MTLHPALRFGMTLTLWAIGFAALSSRMQADEWNKKTIVTINAPIQVTDTVLPPGSYVFMLADSSSDRHIVQIFNRDQSRLINTVMAIPDYRVQPSGHTQFTFYETPKGNPPALHEWFYPGDNFGNEFPYPKHLQTVAAVTPPPAPAPQPPAPVAAPETPAPAPQPEAQVQTAPQQTEQQTQVEIAQNNPPPAAPPAAERPATPAQPETLPKTATPFAWMGLGGLFSLGLFGWLRVQKSS